MDIFKGVQFERARRVVDPTFLVRNKELDDTYYNHWKKGIPKDFYGLNITENTTQKEAELLFKEIAGVLNHALRIAQIKANRNLNDPYPEEKINPIRDYSENRVFKNAIFAKEAEFEKQLRSNPPLTMQEMVDLYNSIDVVITQDSPVRQLSAGEFSLEKIRSFEVKKGVKVRDLLGTLPEV